ncbi:MAG: hypothetical protein ABI634_16980 [Acidobacteriota bacterium]
MSDEPSTPKSAAVQPPFKRYDYYLGPKMLGDMWVVSRGTLKMRCVLATHRLGWELKLSSTSSFSRSQVCKSESEVTSTSDAWLAEAKGKGWS